MKVTSRELLLFVKLSRPHYLLLGMLLYGVGGSIAGYLGRPLDVRLYLVGQALIIFIQLMGQYLHEYYWDPAPETSQARGLFTATSGAIGQEGLPRQTAWLSAVVALGLAATTASALLVSGEAPTLSWVVLLIIFLAAFAYSGPPLRLINSLFGELALSVTAAGLVPIFGYVLQTGEMHRLLLMTTTPLVALFLAMMVALSVPGYASDLKCGRRNLMVRLGWSSAMRIHDAAVVFAVLAFVVGFVSGMPWRVVRGEIILLPLAAAQIWQMARIRAGLSPQYRNLSLGAAGLLVLAAYLLLIGFLLD